MQNHQSYKIQNDDQAPFVISVKSGSRIQDTLEALRNGPFPAPSLRRVSDHVFRLRADGVNIETEFRKHNEDGSEKSSIYHLRSTVTPITGSSGGASA